MFEPFRKQKYEFGDLVLVQRGEYFRSKGLIPALALVVEVHHYNALGRGDEYSYDLAFQNDGRFDNGDHLTAYFNDKDEGFGICIQNEIFEELLLCKVEYPKENIDLEFVEQMNKERYTFLRAD